MLCIWNMKNDITLSTVMEALENEPRAKDWKPQTISTYFRKLVEKKYLKMNRTGKLYTYKALITKEKYRELQIQFMLFYFFNNKKDLFIDTVNNI